MKYATIGSGIWLALVLVYVVFNFPTLRGLEPNELGDFCAGVAAPLAFLWLVVGYMQQGDELRFQAEQLRLQVEESKNLVREAARQAEASTALLEVERQKHREELRRAMVAAQPNLQIAQLSKTGHTWVLTLRNYGSTASELRARVLRGLLSATLQKTVVTTGEPTQIDCAFDPRFSADFEVELEFLDAAQHPRKARIIGTDASIVLRADPIDFEQSQ